MSWHHANFQNYFQKPAINVSEIFNFPLSYEIHCDSGEKCCVHVCAHGLTCAISSLCSCSICPSFTHTVSDFSLLPHRPELCGSSCFQIDNLLHLIVMLAFPYWELTLINILWSKKNPDFKNWTGEEWELGNKAPDWRRRMQWRPYGERWYLELKYGFRTKWNTCFEMHLPETNSGADKGEGDWRSQFGSEHVWSPVVLPFIWQNSLAGCDTDQPLFGFSGILLLCAFSIVALSECIMGKRKAQGEKPHGPAASI